MESSALSSVLSFCFGFDFVRAFQILLKTSYSVRHPAVLLCPESVSAVVILLVVGLELVVRLGP